MSLWAIRTADDETHYVEAGPIEDALEVFRECAEKRWKWLADADDDGDEYPPFGETDAAQVALVREVDSGDVWRSGWEPGHAEA